MKDYTSNFAKKHSVLLLNKGSDLSKFLYKKATNSDLIHFGDVETWIVADIDLQAFADDEASKEKG